MGLACQQFIYLIACSITSFVALREERIVELIVSAESFILIVRSVNRRSQSAIKNASLNLQ